MQLKVSWAELKAFVEGKSLFIQYLDRGSAYEVFAVDGPVIYTHRMYRDSPANTDQDEFETDYKPGANYANAMVIKEENQHTKGRYKERGFECDISALSNETVDVSWPFPVSILSAEYSSADIHEGDQLRATVAPDTIIGTVDTALSIGDDEVIVSPGLPASVLEGLCCKVGSENYMDIKSVDPDNDKIILDGTVAAAQAVGQLIKVESRFLQDVYIGPSAPWDKGEDKIGGSYLEAGKVLRLLYINNEGSAKKFYVNVKYLY